MIDYVKVIITSTQSHGGRTIVLKKQNTTLSYVKALPTPISEMNVLGMTQFELFLYSYAPIYRKALCETVNYLLAVKKFDFDARKAWNSHLQVTYGINKRHANGIISDAQGKVDSARECRNEHIKQLKSKIKSASSWLQRKKKLLKDVTKFYNKRDRKGNLTWINSKTGCRMPLSCDLKYRNTNISDLRFKIHNKKRYLSDLNKKLSQLQKATVHVSVPHDSLFVVGSKDESCGNQVCQWDGDYLIFRVPYCLEKQFGKIVKTKLGNFERNVNRLPTTSALSWHFYRKHDKWNACVQFTPIKIQTQTRSKTYGVIAFDLNPSSIDWCELDHQGNLVRHGSISLQQGLPRGKMQGQLTQASLFLKDLALETSKPLVHEKIDFTQKKSTLKERGGKYARMLSQWAYSKFFEILHAICANRDCEVIPVTPQYTSFIGLIKYVRIYGVNSGVGAAIVIGRRAMKFSERIPVSLQAQQDVKSRSHNWKRLSKFYRLIKSWFGYINRHVLYVTRFSPNWECMVKFKVESPPVVGSTEL